MKVGRPLLRRIPRAVVVVIGKSQTLFYFCPLDR